MREFLIAMSDDEITVRDLCKRVDRTESHVRRCLDIMWYLGLVEKRQVSERGSYKRQKFVWKRLVTPKDCQTGHVCI